MQHTLAVVLIAITLATSSFFVESYPMQQSFPPNTSPLILEKRNPAAPLIIPAFVAKASAVKAVVGSRIMASHMALRAAALRASASAANSAAAIKAGAVNAAARSSAAIKAGAVQVGTTSKKVAKTTTFKVGAGLAVGAGVGAGTMHLVNQANKSDWSPPSKEDFDSAKDTNGGTENHSPAHMDSEFSSAHESWRNSMS